MLAPEDESRAIDALRFSLASDIVELVVLTADDSFLQTLREAVGAARRLWHVPSSDKVSDLLVAGGVGILVLDVPALTDDAPLFITQIKRQFPDLVIVVAGNRGDETGLARLISDGTVYRFIHKPMSPARARLFADAAVKRYDEQRRRSGPVPTAPSRAARNGGLWFGAVFAVIFVALCAIWVLRRIGREDGEPARIAEARLPQSAGTAAPAAPALSPSDDDAREQSAEIRERLLARAESALLEDRLDEAAAAIEAARKAGVEGGRVAFLSAQLAKARGQNKASASLARTPGPPVPAAAVVENQADHLAALAMERIRQQRLVDPDRDNARYYVQAALKADPQSDAAQQAEQALALELLTAVRGAIDRRDFEHASGWLDAAAGIAAPANVDNLRRSLIEARRAAEADAADQLLKSAQQRLSDDRLIEPENDSAKHYLAALRAVDPSNAELQKMTQELGARLISKARGALTLRQYDAARGWLDQASTLGYSTPDSIAVLRDLDAADTQQQLPADVVSARRLELSKSVPPVYPRKAEKNGVEGWVELDFTVAETGAVKDAAVHAADPLGVFDQAAIAALSQWRYQPVVRDGKPVAQRARIRMRFTLTR